MVNKKFTIKKMHLLAMFLLFGLGLTASFPSVYAAVLSEKVYILDYSTAFLNNTSLCDNYILNEHVVYINHPDLLNALRNKTNVLITTELNLINPSPIPAFVMGSNASSRREQSYTFISDNPLQAVLVKIPLNTSPCYKIYFYPNTANYSKIHNYTDVYLVLNNAYTPYNGSSYFTITQGTWGEENVTLYHTLSTNTNGIIYENINRTVEFPEITNGGNKTPLNIDRKVILQRIGKYAIDSVYGGNYWNIGLCTGAACSSFGSLFYSDAQAGTKYEARYGSNILYNFYSGQWYNGNTDYRINLFSFIKGNDTALNYKAYFDNGTLIGSQTFNLASYGFNASGYIFKLGLNYSATSTAYARARFGPYGEYFTYSEYDTYTPAFNEMIFYIPVYPYNITQYNIYKYQILLNKTIQNTLNITAIYLNHTNTIAQLQPISENETFKTYEITHSSNLSGLIDFNFIFTMGGANLTSSPYQQNISFLNITVPSSAYEIDFYNASFTLNKENIQTISGSYYYDGRNYNATITSNATHYNLTAAIPTPNVTASTNVSNNLFLNIKDIYNRQYFYNITSANVTINPRTYTIQATSCTPLTASFINNIENTGASVNLTLNYLFNVTRNGVYYKILNGTLTNVASLYFCVTDGWVNTTESVIEHTASGYTTRRYYLINANMSSNNYILYTLPTSAATSYTFYLKDASLNNLPNHYIAAMRWYPAKNTYSIVEIEKTDDLGRTIFKLQDAEATYRFAVYNQQGGLIYMSSPSMLLCQEYPCTYTLKIKGNETYQWQTIYNQLQVNLTYNETTGILSFIWNDLSGKTEKIYMNVYKLLGSSELNLCNVTGTGPTGFIYCNLSGYSGTFGVKIYREASPKQPLIQKVFEGAASIFSGYSGLIIGFILLVLCIFLAIYSPILVLVLLLPVMIILKMLGVLTWNMFFALAFIVALVLLILRRAS